MTINGLNKSSSNFDFALADPNHHTSTQCKEYIKQYFVPLVDGIMPCSSMVSIV